MRNNVEIKGLIIQETKKRIRKNPKLTIKEIADACFVNIAAVNYHFGRKDNLMAIVVKEILDELKETSVPVWKPSPTIMKATLKKS